MASQEQIEHNNLEAHSAVLKQEIGEKAQELNSLTKSVDAAKGILTESNRVKKEHDELMASELQKLADARKEFSDEKEKHEKDKKTGTDNLQTINSNIGKANKELARINASCLNATTDLDNKNKEIAAAQEKLLPLTDLVLKFEEIKENIRLAEIELARVTQEAETLKKQSDVDMSEAKEQLANLRNESQVKQMEVDTAAFNLKSYTDQLYTAMNDYQVIKTRLENVWGKTFPELEIPLAL